MGLGDVFGGIGSFVGDLLGQGDRDRAGGYLDSARQNYEGINPTISSNAIGSKFDSIDPATRSAQLEALQQFQNQYRNGGMDAVTRANLAESQGQAQGAMAGNRAALADDAARRGTSNGATALMQAQLGGSQAANLASQQGLQSAALAQRGRMSAAQGAAGVAGGIRGQDYQRAAAQDAISRFNEANRMNAQQMSVGNQLSRAGGIAGVYGAQAGQANAEAENQKRRWAGLGQGIGGLGDMGDFGGRILDSQSKKGGSSGSGGDAAMAGGISDYIGALAAA